MNELICIRTNETGEAPTVSGRELHEALEVNSNYTTWFNRMCEYGFTENVDFTTCFPNLESEKQHGGQNKIDHELTLQMAKEICMIQRTEKGKQFRQYFIQLEEKWNSPEAVLARALQFANRQLDETKEQIKNLELTVNVQNQQIAELQPKASYYDLVLNCPDLLSTTQIAKDYGKSAVWLNNWLHEHGIQFKQSDIWILYQKYAQFGYTSTNVHPYNGSDGTIHTRPHTYWTQKGRLFIYEQLKKEGILPTIEKEKDDNKRGN